MTTHENKTNSPVEVSAERLSSGTWCHDSERKLDEGDIISAYSADMIAFEGRIRTPFQFKGALYSTIGTRGRGRIEEAMAYRLLTPKMFGEPTSTYDEKVREDNPRANPNGFYHGMVVKHRTTQYVLVGPAKTFRPSDEPVLQQGSLF